MTPIDDPVETRGATPEFIAASDTHTKAEKLKLLEEMKRDALLARENGKSKPADADLMIGEIDAAIAQVKRGDVDEAGIVSGRATSA